MKDQQFVKSIQGKVIQKIVIGNEDEEAGGRSESGPGDAESGDRKKRIPALLPESRCRLLRTSLVLLDVWMSSN
ncbi:MAG TPA: hypothetical protein VKW06_11455 [Candidatus Angelobacter sp.]|nr:hypothetical protein [Candidatus Angelobacter sp.]